MMLYNFVLLLTEQDRVKRQMKGITNLIQDSPGKKEQCGSSDNKQYIATSND